MKTPEQLKKENETLAAEVATLTASKATAEADLTASQSLVEETQEKLTTEIAAHAATTASLTQANADLTTEKASLATVKASLNEAGLTLGTAEGEASLSAQIKTKSSAEAARVVASQGGQAALETGAGTQSNSTEGNNAQGEPKKLTGRAAAAAEFTNQLKAD